VLVENRVDADGAIAGDAVARAAPDGYTYLFANATTMVGVPVLRKSPPYASVAPRTKSRRFISCMVSPSVPACYSRFGLS